MAHLLTRATRQRRSRSHAAFWAAYASVYDLLWDNALTELVARRVVANLPASAPVLEVGAGTGLITRRLAATGADIVAAEPREGMRRRFRRRLPDVPMLPDAIENLSPDPGGTRTVVAVNVLHLVADPFAAASRLRELGPDEGTVLIVTPHRSVTVWKVARAIRRRGGSRIYVARFIALHAALAPLTTLAATGVGPKALEPEALGAEVVEVIDEVSDLWVIRRHPSP